MDAKNPKEGDMIEFPRSGYKHYGLYTGDGEVVHFTPGEGKGGSLAPSTVVGGSVEGAVRTDKLQDVAGTTDWKVNNIQDNKQEPKPTQEIVAAALSSVGQERPYSATSSNCEHFATECRYGKAESAQVKKVEKAAENFRQHLADELFQ
ncbi:phospholipase A and acyltransferase 4-like [Scomber scombrus]|uniref:Phospholipase A and acyltransferase 4-like n=1 Tax=Scomber scombrus TaxID=13677 RepID=A0AAV1P0Z3_SCOSC